MLNRALTVYENETQLCFTLRHRRLSESATRLLSKIVQCIKYVARIRENYRCNNIYACDETAVWLNASGGKTVEEGWR
uniref:Transposase n=1 Tax=Ditylenchus dipsaci TaxID=166011 RepID=A0A915E736_9BILA